jgi:hypothetical protein
MVQTRAQARLNDACVFRSQLEYGSYGHLLCTPVSCALGVAFLVADGRDASSSLRRVFCPSFVDSVMKASHALFSPSFCVALMLSEIQDRIPTESVRFCEIAGMTTCGSPGTFQECCTDDFTVCSLSDMLTSLQRSREACAVVVTTREHTTCWVVHARQLYHFDPLPASWRLASVAQLPLSQCYSGLLLYKAGHAPPLPRA